MFKHHFADRVHLSVSPVEPMRCSEDVEDVFAPRANWQYFLSVHTLLYLMKMIKWNLIKLADKKKDWQTTTTTQWRTKRKNEWRTIAMSQWRITTINQWQTTNESWTTTTTNQWPIATTTRTNQWRSFPDNRSNPSLRRRSWKWACCGKKRNLSIYCTKEQFKST